MKDEKDYCYFCQKTIPCGGEHYASDQLICKELRTRVAELTNHEEQTHKELGDILGTDDSLKNCALRLQNRLSTLEKELKEAEAQRDELYKQVNMVGGQWVYMSKETCEALQEYLKQRPSLEQKLSTLLKASGGMEKALDKLIYQYGEAWDEYVYWYKAKQALADFRAMKEGL